MFYSVYCDMIEDNRWYVSQHTRMSDLFFCPCYLSVTVFPPPPSHCKYNPSSFFPTECVPFVDEDAPSRMSDMILGRRIDSRVMIFRILFTTKASEYAVDSVRACTVDKVAERRLTNQLPKRMPERRGQQKKNEEIVLASFPCSLR